LPGTVDQDGLLQVPFGGFLATDQQGHRVVFDLGGGPVPQLLPGGELPAVRELMPAALENLGCQPDSVTDVVFTNLHIDQWAGLPPAAGPPFAMTMSRRQSSPQNAVTAATASSIAKRSPRRRADRTAIELTGDLSSQYLQMKGDIT
jgi:hypothetical protein